jgi:serine/threonine protein kinase/Flp pilus assembly protein TadD
VVAEDGQGGVGETQPFKVLTPGTMISHYKIIDKIGEGGMGVVYKALDTRLDRTVALKFLPPRLLSDADARARFEHEAKSASALNHPNITTIYEIDEVEGRAFIAMEFIDGRSLKDVLRDKPLELNDILDIAMQMAEGLGAAHEQDVIHRDVKPDNIMVTPRGRVKVMDFGLAKLRGVTRLTKTGTTLGTLRYMSPEQAEGKELDRRSDLFSFGVILYEMITGRLPFKGDNEAAVIHSIISDTPEPLARYKADVPDGMERIVTKALAKDRDERYQDADDLLADLRREKRVSERIESFHSGVETEASRPRNRLLRLVALAALAAVIAIVYFVFEPFRVEVGPKKEATAEENSLAIMYFENVPDPADSDRLAQMITSLLITDLSESQRMYVVSRQRLYDILKILGKEDLKAIDKTVASEVAEKAGVRWMLTGDILQTEPNIVLTSDISEAATGKVLATQRVTGESGEDIFAVVDKLSRAIRTDLAVPAASAAEPETRIAELTTHSPEAYRCYVEGVDYSYKHYYPEATASFKKAVEYDSTFAMAYHMLAFSLSGSERAAYIAKALRFSDHATERERLWIKARAAEFTGDYPGAIVLTEDFARRYPDSRDAQLVLGMVYYQDLGDAEKAIPHYRRAVEIDPYYKEAYNQMAYAYSDLGDLDNAIWAINEYIALAPDEANPYDSRGDLYAFNGKVDEALASYRKASEIKPRFSTVREGAMYLLTHEYAQAESCYKDLVAGSTPVERAAGRMGLALIPTYQGRFDEALRILDDGIGADKMEGNQDEFASGKYRIKATILIEKRDFASAVEPARRCMELREAAFPSDPAYTLDFYVYALARAGEFEAADSLTAPLREKIETSPETATSYDWLACGSLAHVRGNTEQAIRYLTRALETSDQPYLHIRSQLARSYMDAGRLGEAVELLEAALARYDDVRSLTPIESVKAHYRLGVAYEGSGWTDKAIEQYETFLDIWEDADPDIPVLQDARRRLARLKESS